MHAGTPPSGPQEPRALANFLIMPFVLRGLLLRIPALPDSIPHDRRCLQGHSTWTNTNTSCSLREKTEKPHSISLRNPRPFTVTASAISFQVWGDTPSNGIFLLILGWAYILNATVAEKQGLPLQIHCFDGPIPPAPPAPPMPLNISYATPEELSWWKVLTTRGTTLSANGLFLPWSLMVTDLGGLHILGYCKDPGLRKLPSATQAAAYLARLCSAYNLGSQCSAALAAVLSFRVRRRTQSHAVTVPNPRVLSPCFTKVASLGLSQPREFSHLSYYMTLALSNHALLVVLESLLWEADVPCNHAGQWTRPIRNIFGPIMEAKDYELLAKVIAFSSAKAAPLWLGTLICGEYPYLLESIDWSKWYGRTTVDVTAWTGIARSFMALPGPGPYMRNGTVSRSDVWRLRRDLRDLYDQDEDDYTLEPLSPWRPLEPCDSRT